jgi:hypothetical protein
MQVVDSQTITNLHFCLSTDSGKLFEHIYGFLMVVEQILERYAEKNSDEKRA